MTEINRLNARIADLKMQYQEAERMNLKNKAGELLVDINYLEELRELRSKQELFIRAFDKIRTEILEYIDDLDIAAEICDIFEKYKVESEDKK